MSVRLGSERDRMWLQGERKKRERETNRQVLEGKCKNKVKIQRELRSENRQMCVCEKEREEVLTT